MILYAHMYLSILKKFCSVDKRNDASKRDLKFDKTENKLTFFTDKTTFLVKDVSLMKQTQRLMKVSHTISSPKINVDWSARHLDKVNRKITQKNELTVDGLCSEKNQLNP